MSCVEGLESGIYIRALLLEALHPEINLLEIDAQMLPIVTIADCKSLYDTIHREGSVRLPSERRLALDLTAIREAYKQETPEGPVCRSGRAPLRWVPTKYMPADSLTKICDGELLREALCRGTIHVHQDAEQQKREYGKAHESQVTLAERFPSTVVSDFGGDTLSR